MRRTTAFLIASTLLLSGCSQAAPTQPASNGPGKASRDPVIAAAAKAATSAPEAIAGYVVTFVKPGTDVSAAFKIVVMKDGRFYRLTGPPGVIGDKAPARAQPESASEARDRKAALTRASATFAARKPLSGFYGVAPQVQDYVVRTADGSYVLVSPDGSTAVGAPPLVIYTPGQ